jgi:malate dehydrogenase (oxaloacetate-decarboxylating)(NADP+)
MRGIMTRATNDPKRVVFPEGEEPKVLRAAQICADEGIAHPVLLGRRDVIARVAAEHGVATDDLEIVDPDDAPRRPAYVRYLWERRQRKGLSLARRSAGSATRTTSGAACSPWARWTRCCRG